MQLIKDNITPVVQILIEEALDGDMTSARALLSYHQQESREFANAPDLAEVPVEARHEEIFRLVAQGQLSLDHAERLSAIVASQMRMENTTRFLTFLREIAEGADPVQVARRLAAEIAGERAGAGETGEELH